MRFEVAWRGAPLGTARLRVSGRLNALNALAALGAAVELGHEPRAALAALAVLDGLPGRRFEQVAAAGGVRVISVYVVNGRTLDDPMFEHKLTFLEAMEQRLAALAGTPYDDPRSAFNGVRRFVDINTIRISNADGPTAWFTNPFGRGGRTEPFPGSIRQWIAKHANRGIDLHGAVMGRDRDYDAFESLRGLRVWLQ
jgi:hypothetical protein